MRGIVARTWSLDVEYINCQAQACNAKIQSLSPPLVPLWVHSSHTRALEASLVVLAHVPDEREHTNAFLLSLSKV